MLQFINTEYLNYAWCILPGLVLLWLFVRWRARRLKALADQPFLNIILPGNSNRFFIYSGLLLLIVTLFIVLALANPVGATKPVKGKRSGLDIAIALDVSKSMDAQDIKPSRLSRATQFISNLNEKLSGNRIGLVVFAGNAFVQMPMTSDAPAMKLFLGNISTDMIENQGTAIGDAIETATEMLYPNGKSSGDASKIIVLLTDGEDHDTHAVEIARDAAKKGITIFTIGVGSADGGPIPIYMQGVLQGYMKDNKDETVISKLDAGTLEEIASATHGTFFRLNESGDVIQGLQKKMSALARGEQDFEIYDQNETLYQWFAGAALFLLLLESVLKFRNNLVFKNSQ